MNKRTLLALGLAAMTVAAACKDDKAADAAAPQAENAAPPAAEAVGEANAGAAAEDESSQWITSELYGVKFRVPADWKVTKSAEGVTTTAADGSTTAILVGSESENMLQSAINDLKSQIELKDVRFEKSGLTTINGLAGSRGTGAAVVVGKNGDEEIQFLAYSLKVGKKTVTMFVFSEATMYEAQKEIIDGIAQTITPTN